ncbi:right-handed parallel beta-helix repeat-containing protein [Flammeovirgaceae bacterium SG7u.132]|nr:right-handed parallel beta-helix repeat-containing protein [Flammeovirgaceae bacterium SG7u.132]
MKNLNLIFLTLFPIFILSSCGQLTPDEDANVFYIDTQEDFDKWSNHQFPAGSKVLFAEGETFKGQFILQGAGTVDSPNIASAYNKETKEPQTDWIDNKPKINGEGKVISALLLKCGSNWEINNIEVTNTNGTKEQQGKLLGINAIAEDVGTVENITIKNCFVHRVNGDVGGKQTGGIHVLVLGDSIKTKFHNLTIENNTIANTGGVGISNQSSWGGINTDEYHPWTNFVIRKNRVEHTGRNGIIIRYALNPLVEYNVLAYNSRFDTGHSVFNFNTTGCIVQYNEAYGNTSDNPDDIDHGGFDADYQSKGTVIQYNYSHDNNWFCGIMRKGYNSDITIRYNVSQNELLGGFLYGFPSLKGVEDVKIYNNTLYFGKGKGKRVFVNAGKKDRIPIETSFWNNIFYFEDEATWGFEPDETCVLENNLYFNVSPKGANPFTGNPLFVNPGTGGTDIDMTDPNRLAGYKLKEGSPALFTGKKIEDNGGKDFAGGAVSATPNIGAF